MPVDPAADSNPKSRRRANRLDGKRWLQNSISVWNDLRKTAEEGRFQHPAMFPGQLVERLIDSFLPPEGNVILDPFAGSGSTIVTAAKMGLQGIGLELSPEYVELGKRRLSDLLKAAEPAVTPPPPKRAARKRSTGSAAAEGFPQEAISGESGLLSSPASVNPRSCQIYQASASDVGRHVAQNSVDLCITSPPYWDILNQRRTADLKRTRNYGNLPEDLGTVADYQQFLDQLTNVFQKILAVLKPRAYCCVVVMDLRKKNQFFPFHSDLAARLQSVGYRFDDLIIWNRQSEYNNLRPLGYPSVFRINKVHEYVLLMQKTDEAA